MATRAISADVKAANSKLAQFLRRQEEEENILQIGKRKPKQLQEERLPGGRGRWQLDPDWKAPTPMVDRPRTVAGATSFHFSYISVAKQGVPTRNGDPVEGRFGSVRNAALDHSKYIERDGAAEVSQGVDHANYIERDGAAEMVQPVAGIDPVGTYAEARERTLAAVVNETPTADEAELLGIEAVAPEGIPSVFSNISDDPFERQEFWRAVERTEASPRRHNIILEPDIAPAWWAALQTTKALPDDFKQHALMVAEAYRQHLAQPVAEGTKRKPFKAQPFPCRAEEAGAIIEAAQSMRGYNDYAPPFEFQSGRGGRIQFRMVAELPHELSAEDRALIVQNFCDHLATLEEREDEAGDTYKTGMMYTAVIHAPDSHNDSRNYHLHIVAYDRPAEFLPERGMWDFEVSETYNHKGEDRIRWPYRQKKIGEVTQGSAKTGKENSGRDFIPALRGKFAEINNAVLKARGIQRRLDPRKYSEMGIDRTPTEHLGTKAAALESIGVPTTVGQLNALAIWSDAERSIKRQAAQASKTYRSTQAELDAVTKRIGTVEPNYPRLNELRAMVVERERLIQDVADDREAIMTFDHLEAKAKSRAIRTRQTCLQFLADIENGKADRSTKMMRLTIQDRWNGAQKHIESIDRALEPHRQALAKAARDIEAREKRIREIDVALQPLVALVTGRIDHFEKAGAAASGPASQQPAAPTAGQSTMAPTPSAPVEQEGAEPTDEIGQPAQPTQAESPTVATPANDAEIPVEPPVAANDVAAAGPDDTEQDNAVAVEPPSISGLPIVEPTIAPPPTQTIDPADVEPGTPKGLEPLRPMEPEAPVEPGEPVVISDLDKSDQPAPIADRGTDSAEPESVSAGPQPTSPKADEPKVDKRKKVTDPALFDLPVQEPPVKPGTSRAAYVQFDELIVRIMDTRVPIHADKQADGTTKFRVPSLNDNERDTLDDPRFAHRANQRLGAIYSKQQNEIQRAVRWVQTAGQNPALLNLENRQAKISTSAKASVKTLFKHWGKHPAVVEAFRAEYDRRIEQEKVLAKQQAVEAKAQLDLKDRQREAAKLYPTPDQAFTPEVAKFIELLREAAPAKDLQEAAARIQADPRAREDIQKHNVHLATAYQQHVEEVDARVAQRIRDEQSKGR